MFPGDAQNSLLLELLRRVDILQHQIDQRNHQDAYLDHSVQPANAFALSQRPLIRNSYPPGASTKRFSTQSLGHPMEEPFEVYDGFFIHTGITYVPCYISSSNGSLLLRLATDSFVFPVPFAAIRNVTCNAIQLPDTAKLLYISRISYTDEAQGLHNNNTLTIYSPSKNLSEQLVAYLVREAKLISCDNLGDLPSNISPDAFNRSRGQSYSKLSFTGKSSQMNRPWRDSQFSYRGEAHDGFLSTGTWSAIFAPGMNLQGSGLKDPVEAPQKLWFEASAVSRRPGYPHDSCSAINGKHYDTERDMGFYSFTTNTSMYDRPLSQSENLRMATGTQASNLMSFGQAYAGTATVTTNLNSMKRNSQLQSDTASVFQQSGYGNPSSQTEPSKKLDGITEKSLNSICNEYERVIEQQNELVTNLWGIITELNRRLEQEKSE